MFKLFQIANKTFYATFGSEASAKLAMSPIGKLIYLLLFKNRGDKVYTLPNDIKLKISPKDAMYCGIGLLGNYNEFETEYIKKNLHPGGVVVDVGAYVGAYSILCSKFVGENGRVYALEPSPAHRKKLRYHMKLNNVINNIKIIPQAASNRNGTALFYEAGSGSSLSKNEAEPHIKETIKPHRVKTTTLNDFVKRENIERLDFLKVDAEGWDLEVLRGASKILARKNAPFVIAEVIDSQLKRTGTSARELITYMIGMGYKAYSFTKDGIHLYDLTALTPNLLFRK